MRGKFITLEGIDGAGKSTQLDWVAAFLRERGHVVQVTREPGGTELGEKLRQMLLDRGQRLHPETETLLVFAARREHLDKVIVPALQSGTWIVCDRFTDATYAYQAGGSGVDWEKVHSLEQWTHREWQPDATILLDLAPELGRSRSGRIKAPDRFEQEQEAFYLRVRHAYLRRAAENPHRMHVIDASADIAAIRSALETLLVRLCG